MKEYEKHKETNRGINDGKKKKLERNKMLRKEGDSEGEFNPKLINRKQ